MAIGLPVRDRTYRRRQTHSGKPGDLSEDSEYHLLLRGFELHYLIGAIDLVGDEVDVIAGLYLIGHRRILDLKHHRNCRHIQVLDGAVLDSDLFRIPVDFSDFALRKRGTGAAL